MQHAGVVLLNGVFGQNLQMPLVMLEIRYYIDTCRRTRESYAMQQTLWRNQVQLLELQAPASCSFTPALS